MNILQRTNQTDKARLLTSANAQTAKRLGLAYATFETDKPGGVVEAIKNEVLTADGAVVYLDENALIYPSGPDWTVVANELLGDSFAAFAVDVGSESERWNVRGLCASQGVFRAVDDENSPEWDFLEEWSAAIDSLAKIKNDRLTVQRALNAIAPKWRANGVRAIEDYYRFAARRGYFVRQTFLDSAEQVEAALGALGLIGDKSEPADERSDEPKAEPAVKKTRKRATAAGASRRP